MRRKDKSTLFATVILCLILSIGYTMFVKYFTVSNNNTLKVFPLAFYALAIVLDIILNIGLSAVICRKNGARFLIRLGKWIMPVSLAFLTFVSVCTTLLPHHSVYNTSFIVFVGLIFIISGNYFPKNHINPYIGLKFPWLLHDEESWNKTHKLASYTWILAGVIFILQLFISPLKIVSIPLALVLIGIIPLIYSLMLVYRKKQPVQK